jgi:ribosomal protein L29
MAKMNDVQDIKSASREDLMKMLKDAEVKLQALKFDLAAGKIKNANEIHHSKKNIARMHTRLNEHET